MADCKSNFAVRFLLSHSAGCAYYNIALDFDGGMILEAKKIFVLGGDKRSEYIAGYFAGKGYEVAGFGVGNYNENPDEIKNADIIVLGLPAIKDNFVNMPFSEDKITFTKLLKKCSKGSVVAGGRFKSEDYLLAQKAGVVLWDYSEDEIFKSENAFYTAEGIVKHIVENTQRSVAHLGILVTGYGRISRELCRLLSVWPCSLTVYARKELARSHCGFQGINTISELDNLSGYDVIVNTVPADIFTEYIISTVKKDALILDVSARPGFVNKEMCAHYGVKLLYLPGIPLTSAPQSAGITAAKAIERFTEGN